jgi:autotransporter-associated beta strand protein
MKTKLSLLLAACVAIFLPPHALAIDEYIWTPTADASGTSGGSAIWNNNSLTWWNVAAGVAQAHPFTSSNDLTVHFYGSGTIFKQFTTLLGNSDNPSAKTFHFADNSNYVISSTASGNMTSLSGDLVMDVAGGATLAFEGVSSSNVLWLQYGGNEANPRAGNFVIQGGGHVDMRAYAYMRVNYGNALWMIRGNTRVDMAANSQLVALSHLGRMSIEDGILNVNGALVRTGYNTSLAAADPEQGYGIAIGAAAGSGTGMLTINTGTVVALGDPRAQGKSYGGIVFGTSAEHQGGVLNLNGGILQVSSIRSNTPNDVLNLAGGTIRASTDFSTNSAINNAITDDPQSRLDDFITGFSGIGNNFVNLVSGTTVIDFGSVNLSKTNGTATIDSAIRGAGSLQVAGNNRALVLKGTNSYSGGTLVAAGFTLRGDSQSLQGYVQQHATGTLVFDQDFDGVFSGTVAGGFFIKRGAGTLDYTISSAGSFSGSMRIEEGALELSGQGWRLASGMVNSSTLIFNSSQTGTYAGVISGAGALVKKGTTTLTLSGTNSYSGGTRVEAGYLNGYLHSMQGDIDIAAEANVSLFQTDETVDEVFSGNLTGSGTFRKRASGTTTLTGDNANFAGTIYVQEGTLVGDTESLAGNIQRNAAATVVFDQDFGGTYSGTFINHGYINKRGTGTLVVTASASGNPTVTVEAGRLLLGSGAYLGGGATTVKAGALAGGNGTFHRLVGEPGATLQVGGDDHTAPETLTVTDRLTVGDATLRFDLFENNASDFLAANAVTGNGGNTIEIGVFATGTFMLGPAATGTLADSSLMIDGLLVVEGARRSGTLTDNGGLQLVTTAANSVVATWLGATSGIWNTTSGNWDSDAHGFFAMGDRVVFDDTADASSPARRTIEVASPGVRVSDLIVSGTGDYIFTGAGIIADATEALGLSGATGKLVKTGSGTLTLANGSNDFRGGIDLGGGVLALGAGTTLGSGTLAVTAADTTLRTTGGAALGNELALAAHGLAVDTGAHDLALAGRIAGASQITKTGAGVLLLSGANAFAGVDLTAGTLAVTHAAAAGGTLKAAGDDVALRFAADGIALASAIDLSTHGLGIHASGHAATLAGALSGGNALAKTGTGVLALTADNSAFTGAVAVEQGALQLASLQNLGSGTAGLTIAADAALLFRQTTASDVTFVRALKGNGTLDIELAGSASRFAFAPTAGLEFSGTVAMGQGAFNLDAGNIAALSNATLSLNPHGTATVESTGTIGGLHINGGTIRIEMDAAGTAPVNPLATGRLDVTSGAVAINLAAFDGAPIINPGHPSIFDQSRLSEIKLIDAATVSGTDVQLTLVRMDGPAFALPVQVDIEQNTGAGPEVAGKADYNYIAQAAEGGLYLGSGLTKVDIYKNKTLLLDNAGASTSDFKAQLTGAGGVEIRATGTITLSHENNNFAGPASLTAGTLKVTKANALASSSAVTLAEGTLLDTTDLTQELANLSGGGDILIGTGTLTIRSTVDTAYAGSIDATTGRLIKTGSASVQLGGSNPFPGGLDVREGTLHATGDAACGTGAIKIEAGAALALETINRDFAEPITGGGALALINSQVRLGAANTLSSVALKNKTRVQVADAGALGGATATVSVADGSTLELVTPGAGGMTVTADSVVVDGGKLLLGQNTSLNAARTVAFKNHGAVGLGGPLQTGSYTLITTGSGITSDNPATNLPDYNPCEFGMGVTLSRDGKNLVMNVYNQAANPAKDVAMAYDTVLAALGTVYSRMSESFLLPLTGRRPKGPAHDFWIKGFGTIGDYEQTPMQIGFTDRTYGVMTGYDRVLGENLLLGAWAGFAASELKTDNQASANADQQLFGAYGAVKLGRWHMGMDAAGGFMQAGTSRYEYSGVAQGCYKAACVAASMEIGFALGAWERGTVRPTASVHYMNLHYKDQWEKGAGAVQVEDFTHEFVQSSVKLQATQGFDLPWGWASVFEVSAGWRQNLSGGDCPVRLAYVTNPGASFDVEAGGCVRGSAVLGLGFRTAVSEVMSLGLGYDFEVTTDRHRHSANASIRWMW